MAFSESDVTRVTWLSLLFPCCRPRPAKQRRGNGGRNPGLNKKYGDRNITSPANPIKPKPTRFYGMQPLPDPVVSKRSISPSTIDDPSGNTASSSSSAVQTNGEKAERVLGEPLAKVPEDEVCNDFLCPAAYLLSCNKRGQTIQNDPEIPPSEVDRGLELIVEGDDQIPFDIAPNGTPETRPQTSYTATFVLDDPSRASHAALADILKAMGGESTDDSTIGTRTTANTEWFLQPLRPAPGKFQQINRKGSFGAIGTELTLAYGGGDTVERRATLRRRDTGSKLELKLINIERAPSWASKRHRQNVNSHGYPSPELYNNFPVFPQLAKIPDEQPRRQLPARTFSISAVCRGYNRNGAAPTEEQEPRCLCSRAPCSKTDVDESGTSDCSRVESWVCRQQTFYRVTLSTDATESSSHLSINSGALLEPHPSLVRDSIASTSGPLVFSMPLYPCPSHAAVSARQIEELDLDQPISNRPWDRGWQPLS